MINLLLINAAAACYMTGLIWFVQLVHYPLFADVDAAQFMAYHKRHMDTTGWAVGPAMVVELASGIALLVRRPATVPECVVWCGFVAIVVLWLWTAIVQVPTHYKLAKGWDRRLGIGLVSSNWLRTIVWSLRAILMVYAVRLCTI